MQLTWSLLRSPVTALCLLEDFLKLQPGDVVVQNGASGSVGRVSPSWTVSGSSAVHNPPQLCVSSHRALHRQSAGIELSCGSRAACSSPLRLIPGTQPVHSP